MERKTPLTCGKCRLYNKKDGVCTVVVVHYGEQLELRTKPNDPCLWEKEGISVEQLRIWNNGSNTKIQWNEDMPIQEEQPEEIPIYEFDEQGNPIKIGKAVKRKGI